MSTTGSSVIDCVCEFTDGRTWLVIQRREDGNVDFNRDWEGYKNGFGAVAEKGDFWLGNVHELFR